MSARPTRVAIYLRVSTDEHDPENQLIQLREFCERWEGHELVAEYVDRESGTRGRIPSSDFFSAVQRLFQDGFPTKVFVAKPYREIYRGFVSREDFESRPRSLPAPPGGNGPFEPIGHDELGWHDGPGPGYQAEDAKDAIKRRYENSLAPIRHTLPRLVRDPRFCALVSDLREEGWKDWHVLLAAANAAANERLNRAFPANAWRSGMMPEMRRLMSEEETREEAERLPDSVFSEENIRFSLKTFVTTFAQYFGLETHQRTPDFPGLERLLTERYGLKDDVEHDQVFGPCDET